MQAESWVFRVIADKGESLGHFLGRFRRANQLSHKAIAEHLGVCVAWVQDWEIPSRRRQSNSASAHCLIKAGRGKFKATGFDAKLISIQAAT